MTTEKTLFARCSNRPSGHGASETVAEPLRRIADSLDVEMAEQLGYQHLHGIRRLGFGLMETLRCPISQLLAPSPI